jgi:hypothetical protein
MQLFDRLSSGRFQRFGVVEPRARAQRMAANGNISLDLSICVTASRSRSTFHIEPVISWRLTPGSRHAEACQFTTLFFFGCLASWEDER